MSRTYRAEPSNGSYLRKPKHMRAKRELLKAEDEGVTKNRKPLPPDDWEDRVVSVYRGQEWNRR
jgi:hypothetical protein